MFAKKSLFNDLIDENGFLYNFDDWNESFVHYISGDVKLDNDCLNVLDAIRKYYKKNGIAPEIHVVSKIVSLPSALIIRIFPYDNQRRVDSSYRHICRLAGIPFSGTIGL